MQLENKIKLLKFLEDALNAAEEIELNTLGLSVRSYEVSNIKWVVERGIEIISEALKTSVYTANKYSYKRHEQNICNTQ